MPTAFALVALGILVLSGFHHVNGLGVALAGLTVLLVIVRAAWTFRENMALLESSQIEAVTDALTGLGNRRQMNHTLADALAAGPESPEAVLLMFDLDGFKLYNDQFGHLAGDTMLAHLGHRLSEAVIGVGSAFRLGGDEFCVLLRCDPADADVHVAAACTALTAEGEGFHVGASHGLVELPAEADSPMFALRLADHRMYAKKGSRRGSAREQTHNVLLGLLREREPDLHEHLRHVGVLAADVARDARPRPRLRSTTSSARRNSTTSARRPSPTRSSTSRGRSPSGSGSSCGATPTSASGSSPRLRR